MRELTVIMELSAPVVMRGAMTESDWSPFSWSSENWVQAVTSDSINVRTGVRNQKLGHPQWERFTETMEVKTRDYFDQEWRDRNLDRDKWSYFDYQYMSQIIKPDKLKCFSWSKFGLVDRDGADSTLWMGTEGAHTPCHQDTYGCNLVCQVSGTKTWTLFPPSESQYLGPTRVPYEESSVYSQINFINLGQNPPHLMDNLRRASAYQVTLDPGDVLFVPHHWWHQVVTTSRWSVSVNTWIPTPEDDQVRLQEALVRYQVALVYKQIQEDRIRKYVLNPNEDDLAYTPIDDLNKLIELTVDNAVKDESQTTCDDEYRKIKFVGNIEELKHVTIAVPEASKEEEQLESDISRIVNDPNIKMINALTDKNVINEAAKALMNKVF